MNANEARKLAGMDKVLQHLYDQLESRARKGFYSLTFNVTAKNLDLVVGSLESEGYSVELDNRDGQSYRNIIISWGK